MMSKIKFGLWLTTSVMLVSFAAAQSYTITDLGYYSQVAAINNHGAVVGNSGSLAFLWTPTGGMQNLGTLPGDTQSYAYAINDSGTIVGLSQGNVGKHAFLWTQAGGMQDLGNLGGQNFAGARGINSSGAVVGFSKLADNVTTHAFLWTQMGGMRDLGTLEGSAQCAAQAINDVGEVVGTCYPANAPYSYHGFFWTVARSMQAIGTLGKNQDIFPLSINTSGRVVGYASPLSIATTTAFDWNQSQGTQSLNLGNQSLAIGINAVSEIVGNYAFEGALDAFIWTPAKHAQDLNDLIPPNSGWDVYEAVAINQSGQIVASGELNGEFHGALLTPVN